MLGLVDVLEGWQELRVIAGHMGGPAWRTAVEAACRTDRLYLEPCCSITDRGRFRYALDRVPVEQMLFGTDSTFVDPAIALGVVVAAGIDRARVRTRDVAQRRAASSASTRTPHEEGGSAGRQSRRSRLSRAGDERTRQ